MSQQGGSLSYDKMKNAVLGEQEMMKMMLELPPEEFEKLMQSSRAWAEAKAKEAEARRQVAATAQKESNDRAWLENENKKRDFERQKAEMAAEEKRKVLEQDAAAKKLAHELEQDKLNKEMERQKVCIAE
jgi:hypothetical protein